MTSQLRGALASQSDQHNVQAQSVDDELMALSSKHQTSQVPNGVTALILSIFAVFGGVVFSFDMQDAQEEEDAEPNVDQPSKEVTKVEGDDQQSDVQAPALWPCTPFHLRGLLRSAVLVIGVVSLAFMTSQLRGALASQSNQYHVQAQSVDDELMALSTKHQTSQVPNGVTALLLSIFTVFGGVVFSFDMQDAQEEEAAEPNVDHPSKQGTKVEGHDQQSEVQSRALWPCTLLVG